MLFPLLALGAGVLYSLRDLDRSLADVVEETVQELHPVSHLQLLLQQADMFGHLFLQHEDPEAKKLFDRTCRNIDAAFLPSVTPPFDLPEKQAHFQAAAGQWRSFRNRFPDLSPSSGQVREDLRTELAGVVERMIHHLERLQEAGLREIAAEQATMQAARQKTAFLILAMVLAAAASGIVAALVLARTILNPLRRIEESARRLGEGDLSFRLEEGGADELGRLMKLVNHMAAALERGQKVLHDMSMRDPLTGLHNRRRFHQLLALETERSRRFDRPLSLLMADLDHFKSVNDHYGHLAGDEALRCVATTMNGQLRQVDHLARFGGEEFAFILPETLGPGAVEIAERLRHAVVAQSILVAPQVAINMTVSIGVAAFPQDGETADALLAAADAALYQAKKAGRNRTVWPELETKDHPGRERRRS